MVLRVVVTPGRLYNTSIMCAALSVTFYALGRILEWKFTS